MTTGDDEESDHQEGRARHAGVEGPLTPGAYMHKVDQASKNDYVNAGHVVKKNINICMGNVVQPKPEVSSQVDEPHLPEAYKFCKEDKKTRERKSRKARHSCSEHYSEVQEPHLPWHVGLDEELGGTKRAPEKRNSAPTDTRSRCFGKYGNLNDSIGRESEGAPVRGKHDIRAELGIGAFAVAGPADNENEGDSTAPTSLVEPVPGIPGEIRLEEMNTMARQEGSQRSESWRENYDEEEARVRGKEPAPFVLCIITARRCFAIIVLLAVVIGVSLGTMAATGAFGNGKSEPAEISGESETAESRAEPDDIPMPIPIPIPTPSPTDYVSPDCKQSSLPREDGMDYENYGTSVAIDGDTVVVGADNILPQNRGSPIRSGTAYVYTRKGASAWVEQARIQSNEKSKGDQFGRSVAVDGNTAVIGAIDTNTGLYGGEGGVGCVYVFTRTTGTDGEAWTQQAKLLPDNPREAGVAFGSTVAVYEDTIIIGMDYVGASFLNGINSGSVYIFTRSDSGDEWTQQAKIVPHDGQTNDRFGHSVALHDNTAIIGAPRADANEENSGAVYVYVRSDGNWTLQDKLIPKDGGNANDSFGSSVAVHDDRVVVGASSYNSENNLDTGSAYVFVRFVGAASYDNFAFDRVGTKWAQHKQLLARDGRAHDYFGQSVALDGDTIIVGTRSGAAYVFRLTGAFWTETTKLLSSTHGAKPTSDGDVDDKYGESVGLGGNTLVIGAHEDNERGINSGSAYAINLC